jgi:hypothetical protein
VAKIENLTLCGPYLFFPAQVFKLISCSFAFFYDLNVREGDQTPETFIGYFNIYGHRLVCVLSFGPKFLMKVL